jgi:hypothetical protein
MADTMPETTDSPFWLSTGSPRDPVIHSFEDPLALSPRTEMLDPVGRKHPKTTGGTPMGDTKALIRKSGKARDRRRSGPVRTVFRQPTGRLTRKWWS